MTYTYTTVFFFDEDVLGKEKTLHIYISANAFIRELSLLYRDENTHTEREGLFAFVPSDDDDTHGHNA